VEGIVPAADEQRVVCAVEENQDEGDERAAEKQLEEEADHGVEELQDEGDERTAEDQQEENSRYHAAEEQQVVGAAG